MSQESRIQHIKERLDAKPERVIRRIPTLTVDCPECALRAGSIINGEFVTQWTIMGRSIR